MKIKSRQSTIKPWSATRIMARELVLEMIEKVMLPPAQEEGEVWSIPDQEKVDSLPVASIQESIETFSVPVLGEKSSNMKKMAQQDIRIMILQNKKKAELRKEEIRKEQQVESDMVRTAENMELALRREEEKSSRLQRGRDQREALLEDIRKKTEEAKQRMQRRLEQDLVLKVEREIRLQRAGRQQMELLEKHHKMEWNKRIRAGAEPRR